MTTRGLAWLLVLTAAAIPAVAQPVERPTKTPVVGRLAPDADMKLADGTRVRLSALRGRVVVLNFWATWCVPCRTELPLLDTYHDLRKGAGLSVFAVATEGSVPAYRMRPLFQRLSLTPVLTLRGPYRAMDAVPTNYVIDRAGRVRYAATGAMDLDKLNAVLIPLLSEPPPPDLSR